MPYYSIHIPGGQRAEELAVYVREQLRGKSSDHTGNRHYFYVQNHRSQVDLADIVNGMVDDGQEVTVRRIKRVEYHWEKHQ